MREGNLPPVLGKVGRRAIDLGVLFLALYAFAFVPLGERTGLEHVQAILGTPAAKNAGRELVTAAERLKDRLLGAAVDEPVPGTGTPVVPKLPRARTPANAAAVPAPALAAAEVAIHAHDGPDASQ